VCHFRRLSALVRNALPLAAAAGAALLAGCGGGGGASAPPATSAASAPAVPAQLQIPAGFTVTVIANVGTARELAALPNGDLLVGTLGTAIMRIPAADAAVSPQAPQTFATLADDKAASVFYGPDGNVYAATEHAVWRIGYSAGGTAGGPIARIAGVRTGPISPTTDGDVHTTTSIAVSGSVLYAGVGSSCNACAEVDPTRASVAQMALDGSGMTTKAKNIRNAIALAVDPATHDVWAGGAGQDELAFGHPYETLDPVSARAGVADYGWPVCYEDAVAVPGTPAAACAAMTVPQIAMPAYATLIGAVFYPSNAGAAYAFPASYRGGLFVSMHGSWHTNPDGTSAAVPQVAYVPFSGGRPAIAVNWGDPALQWKPFFTNFGTTAANRVGRPTGLAVGPLGSLFVADDLSGNIYRIRAATAAPQARDRR
jgi:glucose/arabinose dehydrogenase